MHCNDVVIVMLYNMIQAQRQYLKMLSSSTLFNN